MQFAIVNLNGYSIVDKIDAETDQKAIDGYGEILAKEYGLETVQEFVQAYPMVAAQLRAVPLH